MHVGWMLTHQKDGLLSLSFWLILDSSVDLWVGIQSADDLVSQTSQLRILHSAEEDNLSPFHSKIACLWQNIKINNNKHVYHQSQVRKPIVSEVKWAECLLIIEAGIPYADDLVSQTSELRILYSAVEDNLSPFDS